MANIKKFDREEAIAMRRQGMSYESIATTLGCSYAWCAKELRGVEKGDPGDGVGAEVKQATKEKAIAVLEEALAKVRSL
jgi:hypothetical protein